MTPAERLAMFTAETAGLIHVGFVFLLVFFIAAVYFGILYGLERSRRREERGKSNSRERQLGEELAKRALSIVALEERIGDVEFLKKALRRESQLRTKTERRLVEQNDELNALRAIVEHLDLPTDRKGP